MGLVWKRFPLCSSAVASLAEAQDEKSLENDLLIAGGWLTVALHLALAGQELPLSLGFALSQLFCCVYNWNELLGHLA